MKTLYDYQKIAREHIRDTPRCALWAGMGMGKTTAALHAVTDLMVLDDVERVLVIGPKRVAQDVWSDEALKWPNLQHLKVQPILGSAAQRKAALRNDKAQVYTINYENLPWLAETLGEVWPFDTVIADEASKLRGFRTRQGTSRAKALAQYAHTKTRRFIELTGTPAANSLTALWGQAWFLDGGQRLGRSFEAFRQRWFSSDGEGAAKVLTPLPFAHDQITEALADLCLTLRAGDWLDLRVPIHNIVTVKLPPQARSIYKEFKKEMYASLGDGKDIKAFSAASRTIKCLQLASGSVYTNPERTSWSTVHDAKLEALESIVEETSDSAVLASYQFIPEKLRILKHFGKQAADLATPAGLKAFKAGHIKVGVAHPASLGHGVDGLQNVCNVIAFFGHWWDAEERAQITDRVGPTRQLQAGMDRPLFIHDIVAENTVDQVVLARHATKRSVQDLLLEAMRRDKS